MQTDKPPLTQCTARIATAKSVHYFGDGRHRYYLEFRCDHLCKSNTVLCTNCEKKNPNTRTQDTRTFDHGTVFEPIPDQSHIYGGPWYNAHVTKWGTPSAEQIQVAEQHQRDARMQLATTINESAALSAVPSAAPSAVPSDTSSTSSKRQRQRIAKNEVANEVANEVIAESTQEQSTVVKPIEPKKTKPRKKPTPTPATVAVSHDHKEAVIPTHIEKILEEFDTDEYMIEYVKLTPFETGNTSYFRDIKNKLYQKRKDTVVGPYVGRYDPYTETIHTDIPDSDDES